MNIRSGKVLWMSGLISMIVMAGFALPGKTPAGELKWVGCGIAKKAFMGALAAAYEKKTGTKIRLEGGGATRGIVVVSAGKADMGGTCRHALMKEDERNVQLIPVGWDALVVIVHPTNKVGNLTLEQLKGIYTGDITNWKQVGGADRKILVVARAGKVSGVGRMLRELVFKNPEQDFTPRAKIVTESAGVEETVEKDPGAIAVSGVSSAQKRRVKLVRVNGKAPVHENIVDGSYLLYRPLYLVIRQNAPDPVRQFAAFAQSPEGQAVISGEGTVNLKEGARLWEYYRREMKEAGVTPGTF